MSKKPLTTSKSKTKSAATLLQLLNHTYRQIHTRYERLFWQSYMGDHSVNDAFAKAQIARENFRSNEKLFAEVNMCLMYATGTQEEKLAQWALFFSKFQTPTTVKETFKKIVDLEKDIHTKQAHRTEGYTDPKTKKYITASRAQMSSMQMTHSDEKVRKACFMALEELAKTCATELIALVNLRNQYAQALGYEDFYAYKIHTEENMTKQELFALFDTIYDKTKFAFATVRDMEKTLPGLRKPWNRGYLLSGSFTKESDKYFPFTKALERWGRSFSQLGISFSNNAKGNVSPSFETA